MTPVCAEMAKADDVYLRLAVDPKHATLTDAELRALAGLPAPEPPRVPTDPRTFVPVAFPFPGRPGGVRLVGVR